MEVSTHDNVFDVAVIGAGVVGTAIARELTRYRLRCVLVEAGPDVGTGTSKANTAILHTGFDAKPGSLEARLVRRGHALLGSYGPELGIPIERIGALLVAWAPEQLSALPGIAETAARNGYTGIRQVTAEELSAAERHLGRGALGALEIPDESIICPFTTPLAFATQAVVNGATLLLDSAVTRIERDPEGVYAIVFSPSKKQPPPDPLLGKEREPTISPRRAQGERALVHCRYIVNAAGLHADVIDRMLGHDAFTVVPRRGELIVFDKLARPLVNHILLQVPTKVSKGVLVSPTVFGNVMLGPTAEDVSDKTDTSSTARGIAGLYEKGRRIVPELVAEEVTAVYVGLRAATEQSDYQIHFYPTERYVSVGGIRSTGLSASMAIAEYVIEGLRDAGLELVQRDDFRTVRMPNIGEAFPRRYQSAAAISSHPDYGRIVCHCERVTLGEILDAARAPIPARTLDGVRRRTRALLGRCQGFYCAATLTKLLADATGLSMSVLLGVDSQDDEEQPPLPCATSGTGEG